MILVFHIITAFIGIGLATLAFATPSRKLVRSASVAAAATLASGTYLVFLHPSHLVEACIMGLIYFAFVTYGISSARHKLAAISSNN